MTKVSYLVGSSVDARHSLLEEKMASQEFHSILHLVPTKGRVMELETDPKFWLRKRENTLTGVIFQVFEEDIRHKRFKGYRPIDDNLRSLLVKKAIEKRLEQPDGLVYFSRLQKDRIREIDFPGIYRTIARFFSQLIGNNYQDMFVQNLAGKIIRLEERSPGTGEERYALESDLTWLFGDYEELKREIMGYDEDDILSGVRAFLKDGGVPSLMADTGVIFFDGFIHLSRIEEDILFHLFSQADEVWWLIDYDSRAKDPIAEFKDASGREETGAWKDKDSVKESPAGSGEAYRIFAPLVSLMDRLEDAGLESIVERAGETAFLNPMGEKLHTHDQTKEIKCNNLKIRSFANSVHEVRAIAGEIKRIMHEDNPDISHDLGKIRIIFPDLNDYSSIIFEIFSEYGLPFSLTKGLPLSSHPISNIFLHIFKIPMNHFNRGDIFRLFSSDLVRGISSNCPANDDEHVSGLKEEYLLPGDRISIVKNLVENEYGGTALCGIDISLFDRVARRYGLNNLGEDLSGLGKRNLLSVRDFYRNRLLNARNNGEIDDLRSEYYGFIVQAGLLDRRLRPFKELINQNNPQGILDLFSRILGESGFPENIINITDSRTSIERDEVRAMIKSNLKAYSILNELLLASAGELQIAMRLFHISPGYELLFNFNNIFRRRLDNACHLDERNPNVIRVSQWLEIRGRSFDYIFAGGLTADRFPLREEFNFILPEPPKKIFRTLDTVDQSRHLFSHLLRNYRKRLYLSYPLYREEKVVQPSQFLMDLESMQKDGASPEAESGMIEGPFKWEDNPYLSSEHEMLNATIEKGPSHEGTGESFFPLKNVILIKESSAEGIIRGIKALGSRVALDGLFEYDGLVGSAARFGEFLMEKKDIFSASRLETLANCPMRYLFEHIYEMRRIEELGAEASPKDIGEHLHAILSIFFKRLRDEGKNVSDIGLARAFSLAMEAAHDHSLDISYLKRLEFFESQEKEFLAGLDQNMAGSIENSGVREGVLARLLRFEEKAFQDRIPGNIEYEFGYKDIPPALSGKTRLRGYIDRFDLDKSDETRVHVYDYKSGLIPPLNMVKMGLSFQLPVYIRALRSTLQAKRISAAFYSLKKDIFLRESPLKQIINDHTDEAKGLDISGVRLLDDYAEQLIEILKNGRFHHSADGVHCNYCEFRYACYKDDRRMDHLLDSKTDHRIYSGKKNIEKWKSVDQFKKDWKKVLTSMQKAFNLKTASGRKGHFESVMEFRKGITNKRDSLPFHDEYIDELLHEIENFEKRYLSSTTR
ncbi:PD-(D/E)XK nuclease family protein [Thermodesulfobacteriota bacterium]